MKHMFFILAILIGCNAYAVAPQESCPTGYTKIQKKYTTLKSGDCSSGYVKVTATNTACQTTGSSDVCWLYAPIGTSYTDTTGTYQFTEPCMYKDSVNGGGAIVM